MYIEIDQGDFVAMLTEFRRGLFSKQAAVALYHFYETEELRLGRPMPFDPIVVAREWCEYRKARAAALERLGSIHKEDNEALEELRAAALDVIELPDHGVLVGEL